MFAKLPSCRRGAVSVEAAIVFPVLIALVMGAMEFSLMLFTYGSMQTATREVARQMAVNFIAPAAAEALVRERLPVWGRDAATVAVTQTTPASPESNVFNVVVTVPASKSTPVRFFGRAAQDWDLRTEVTMKQELPL